MMTVNIPQTSAKTAAPTTVRANEAAPTVEQQVPRGSSATAAAEFIKTLPSDRPEAQPATTTPAKHTDYTMSDVQSAINRMYAAINRAIDVLH